MMSVDINVQEDATLKPKQAISLNNKKVWSQYKIVHNFPGEQKSNYAMRRINTFTSHNMFSYAK